MKTRIIQLTAFLFFTMLISCNNEGNDKENNQSQVKTDSIVDLTNDKNSKDIQVNETPVKQEEPDKLVLSNEEVIFSFDTENGKTMCLSMDKKKSYLVYRFGKKDNVELQFPEDLNGSFGKFTYNYYFRGGGAGNMGLDLNYVSFTGDTHKIIIYEEYSAGDPDNPEESNEIGIRILTLKSGKETRIPGLFKSKKGSLIDFRNNGLIKIEEGEI